MSNRNTIYSGNAFDVDVNERGAKWTIWRITDDVGGREQITLTQSAMDELAAYFSECYTEDRGKKRER